MISCFRTSFPVLERPFPVLEHPFDGRHLAHLRLDIGQARSDFAPAAGELLVVPVANQFLVESLVAYAERPAEGLFVVDVVWGGLGWSVMDDRHELSPWLAQGSSPTT